MLNEDYEVELLKKLPVYHRGIYEYQQIANVQTPELEKLLVAIDFVLNNWFIETASEYGLTRLEKIAGLTSVEGEDLEVRRYRLFIRMTEKIPYTDETLEEWLSAMCGGSEYYEVVRDYPNYKITINIAVGKVGVFNEICKGLMKMIPCNLVHNFQNTIQAIKTTPLYLGMVTCTTMKYIITNDINCEYGESSFIYCGVGFGKMSTHVITHDVELEDVSNKILYAGMGMGLAHTKIITHDFNMNTKIIGNSAVASPTNTAMIITVSEK